MNLDVLSATTAAAWYSSSLQFTCAQCGNCCTGGPGFVWIRPEELGRLSEFLKLSVAQAVEKYCRSVAGRMSLNEHCNAQGQYDCVFLTEEKLPAAPGRIAAVKRGCAIYPVRPLQCRTWPFWDGDLAARENWDRSSRRCPGMNRGRHYSPKQIEAVRDTLDWPQDGPTSDAA